jgi:hypothetical protein
MSHTRSFQSSYVDFIVYMVQVLVWEARNYCKFMKPKVCRRVHHKSAQQGLMLSQLNPVNTLTHYFFIYITACA